MLEKEIERRLVKEVKRLGGMSYKFVSPGSAGVPDRIVIFKNKPPIFVELKTERGVLTDLQRIQCKRLMNYGQDVRILYGINQVLSFLKEFEKGV